MHYHAKRLTRDTSGVQRWRDSVSDDSNDVLCQCRSCGWNVQFARERTGETVPCPNCNSELLLVAERRALPPPKASQQLSSPNLMPCPDCGREVSTRAESCPGCGLPLKPSKNDPSPVELTRFGRIKTKSESFGVGCLLQLIGLVVIWFFPIGTIAAICLFVMGSAAARYPVCSECGIKLNSRDVRICPACKSRIHMKSVKSLPPVLAQTPQKTPHISRGANRFCFTEFCETGVSPPCIFQWVRNHFAFTFDQIIVSPPCIFQWVRNKIQERLNGILVLPPCIFQWVRNIQLLEIDHLAVLPPCIFQWVRNSK